MTAMRAASICFLLLLQVHICTSSVTWGVPGLSPVETKSWFSKSLLSKSRDRRSSVSRPTSFAISFRCGGNRKATDDKDEERYSRQYYTLGARAHGLVRTATIYLDGPSTSGLLYECGKNLALSGVGRIVVLTDRDDEDGKEDLYHNSPLDDLGHAYEKAALSELGYEGENEADSIDVLVEYLQRLNPSVDVSKLPRSDLEANREVKRGYFLCVDRPQSIQVHLNGVCREHGMPFVAVETAGVFGRTFCDFGSSFEMFDADGETPLVVPLDNVKVDEDENIVVSCIEGEKHDVSKGDQIQFQLSGSGTMSQTCTVLKVQSPGLFVVECPSSEEATVTAFVDQVNAKATSFSRIKVPQELSFVPLNVALERCKDNDSLFAPSDLDKNLDPVRKCAILCCFEAMQAFLQKHNHLPSKEDISEFQSIAQSSVAAKTSLVDTAGWEDIVASFAACCKAKVTPIQAMFGAIGAQEILKAVSGLYNPVQQFLLYDCDELLAAPSCAAKESQTSATAAPGQTYVFGNTLTENLASKRLFVVGAGAIGCELLKNLSAMGAGTGAGRIIVTDMDTIEHSNLSRQLLFRDADIGKFKSKAAHDAVLRFNPAINMEVHTSKVGDDVHGPFDDTFWSEHMNIVLNALDNVEARLFMDGQCVAHRKALIDAGTLGPKGNVQVVIPGQSESYGSSVDPPEPAIPVCTLKNFPYAIAHTIQWGRDLFDGLFQRRPTQANDHAARFVALDGREFSEHLIEKLGADAAVDAAVELAEDLGVDQRGDHSGSFVESSVVWAVETAQKLFHDSIDDLIRQHPEDSVDEDGEPFWSGTRRLPKKLSFSSSDVIDSHQKMVNQNLVNFVRAAARLRIETFVQSGQGNNEDSLVSEEVVVSALSRSDWSSVSHEETEETDGDITEKIIDIVGTSRQGGKVYELNAVEFEKDDEKNGHVDFVTAASNLRALCYGIAPVDALETRRVAGKIVPAMITTTAFVSALSCIELIKLLQEAPLQLHRNAFINLALPFFAFTTPLPAEEIEGLHGKTFTLWDRIVVKERKKSAVSGGMTLRRFLRRIWKKCCADDSVDVSTLAYGPYMIYANFLHEDDEDMLERPFWELLKEAIVSGDDFDDEYSRDEAADRASTNEQIESLERRTFIDLTVVVEEQETGDEIQLPPVRFIKWRQ